MLLESRPILTTKVPLFAFGSTMPSGERITLGLSWAGERLDDAVSAGGRSVVATAGRRVSLGGGDSVATAAGSRDGEMV